MKKIKIIILILMSFFSVFLYSAIAQDNYSRRIYKLKTAENNFKSQSRNPEAKNAYKEEITDFLIYSYENEKIEPALEYCLKAEFHFGQDPLLKKIISEIYFKKALDLLSLKQYNQTINWLEKCQNIFPSKQFKYYISDVFLQLAYKHYNEKNYSLAEENLKKIFSEHPDNSHALYLAGIINTERNRLEEALEYWQKINKEDKIKFRLNSKIAQLKNDIQIQKNYVKVSWKNFDFYVPKTKSETAYALRKDIDNVFRKTGKKFGYYPDYKIAIILYIPEDYKKISDILYPTAGMYDGKIRLPIDNPEKIFNVLKHEYIHLIIRDLAELKAPVWINEGLAVYESGLSEQSKKNLKQQTLSGNIIPLEALDSIFLNSRDTKIISLAYAESFAIIDYLLNRFNFNIILNILSDIKKGKDIKNTLKDETGQDFSKLEENLKKHIISNY